MSDALLELRDLRVVFSRRRGLFKPPLVTRAVDGVSLSVPRGTVFGLVGVGIAGFLEQVAHDASHGREVVHDQELEVRVCGHG